MLDVSKGAVASRNAEGVSQIIFLTALRTVLLILLFSLYGDLVSRSVVVCAVNLFGAVCQSIIMALKHEVQALELRQWMDHLAARELLHQVTQDPSKDWQEAVQASIRYASDDVMKARVERSLDYDPGVTLRVLWHLGWSAIGLAGEVALAAWLATYVPVVVALLHAKVA